MTRLPSIQSKPKKTGETKCIYSYTQVGLNHIVRVNTMFGKTDYESSKLPPESSYLTQ